MSISDPSIWTAVVPSVLALLLALGIIYRLLRSFIRLLRGWGHFLDDFNGEPARPGYPGRPGIPERIQKIEKQFLPNDGHSMRDVVDRLERKTESAARLAADAAEETRAIAEQHIKHTQEYHGEDRRRAPEPEGEPDAS